MAAHRPTSAAAPTSGVSASSSAGSKGSPAEHAAYLSHLKTVLLKSDFGKLREAMKAYKAKAIELPQLVDAAWELLPREELPGFGPYLGTLGNKLLQEKLQGRG